MVGPEQDGARSSAGLGDQEGSARGLPRKAEETAEQAAAADFVEVDPEEEQTVRAAGKVEAPEGLRRIRGGGDSRRTRRRSGRVEAAQEDVVGSAEVDPDA
jgi:hypothetical protein